MTVVYNFPEAFKTLRDDVKLRLSRLDNGRCDVPKIVSSRVKSKLRTFRDELPCKTLTPFPSPIRMGEGGQEMINIFFNGTPQQVPAGTTIEALLRTSGVPVKFCAVERNMEIVPKDDYASCMLEDGDALEVVTLVGGG